MSNLLQRTLVGSLAIAAAALIITYSFTLFLLSILTIQAAAQWEFYRIARAKSYHPLVPLGIGASLMLLIAAAYDLNLMLLLTLPLALLLGFLYFFRYPGTPLSSLSTTFFGAFYILLPLMSALLILRFPGVDGRLWLALALIATKSGDVFAYFVGKFFGKTPLAPVISPKKTREGALAGLAGAVASLYLLNALSGTFALGALLPLLLGLAIGALGQIGDLSESLFKREAKVKDSSALPGLGGVLDTLDSLVFTLPFVYLYLQSIKGLT